MKTVTKPTFRHIIKAAALVFFCLCLSACATQSTSIELTIPSGKEYLHLEQELFQSSSLGVQMGSLGRGSGVRKSYHFNFHLTDPDLIRYAYLSIDTVDVDHPENPLFLNGHPIGFLSRAGYGPDQNQWYAGQAGHKERDKLSRTQRYLPASYFHAGKNTLAFSHQEVRRASQGGQVFYERYTIKNISLAVIKTKNLAHSPPTASTTRGKRKFPGQFQFLQDLTDEELYIALVKLPYLLSEMSDAAGLSEGSLSYAYARIGDYYRWTGHYNRSLAYHRKANRLQAQQPFTLLTPKVRSGLALAYNFVGDYHNAVAECEKALGEIEKIRAGLESPPPKTITRNADHLESMLEAYLAFNYYHLKDDKAAAYHAYRVINYFDDTWAHYNSRKTRIGKYVPIALAQQAMGDLALRNKNYDEALRHYQAAEKYLGYEVRPRIYHDQMIIIQIGIAKTLYHQGKYKKAREILKRVPSPTNAFLWRSYLLQGMIAESRNNLEQAVELYQAAIEEIEFSRARLTSHGLKINFMSDKQEPYARIISCLVRTVREDEAFNYVEKSKARAFLDLIARSDKLIGQKNEVLKELTAEEKRLRETLLSLQHQADMNASLFQERGVGVDHEEEIARARGALGEFFTRWFRKNKDFASLRSADTLGIAKVQALLPAGAGLVEYYYRDNHLYAWIIEPQAFRLVRKEMATAELEQLVRAYRDLVSRPGTSRGLAVTKTAQQAELEDVNRRLGALLVRDVLDTLPGQKIYIIPHGILHYLPFQALTVNGNYLIERYQIGYSPSASVLKHVFDKNKNVKQAILALGNPDLGTARMALPYAEVEVRDIRQIFNQTTVMTRQRATEAAFKKNAGNYDILHIASHGEFNPESPLISCLRLAPGDNEDGRLEMAEIFNLDLKAYLVTLSACNTAMGKMASGDELMGLTRAFMFAGTPSILGTFWSVNDKSTRLLMKHFYSNLKNMDKFESMRQAQIELINSRDYRHPYYWAAFQIIGDYR